MPLEIRASHLVKHVLATAKSPLTSNQLYAQLTLVNAGLFPSMNRLKTKILVHLRKKHEVISKAHWETNIRGEKIGKPVFKWELTKYARMNGLGPRNLGK